MKKVYWVYYRDFHSSEWRFLEEHTTREQAEAAIVATHGGYYYKIDEVYSK